MLYKYARISRHQILYQDCKCGECLKEIAMEKRKMTVGWSYDNFIDVVEMVIKKGKDVNV